MPVLTKRRFKMYLMMHWLKITIICVVFLLLILAIWGLSSLESFYRHLTIAQMPITLLLSGVHAGIFVFMYMVFLRGGFTKISKISGVSRPTLLEGKKELEKGITELLPEKIRKPGGGRKKIYLQHPEVISLLDSMVDPVTRGDPMSPLRWTCKSTRQLAKALEEKGI